MNPPLVWGDPAALLAVQENRRQAERRTLTRRIDDEREGEREVLLQRIAVLEVENGNLREELSRNRLLRVDL